MKRILTQLFSGMLYPYEEIEVQSNDYKALSKRIDREVAAWKEKLSKEDFERLEQLQGLIIEQGGIEFEEAFIYGFRMGALVMTEVYGDKTFRLKDKL